MDSVERLLREKYAPETLQDKGPEKSGPVVFDVNKSALPDLFAFDNVGQWFAACEMYLASFPEKLRDVIIKQALAGYLKE